MREIAEQVARAIYAARGCIGVRPWHLQHASAAIEAHKAALAEAGYVIVPREPTEAMVRAGKRFQSEAAIRGAWRVMIDAALQSHSDPSAQPAPSRGADPISEELYK